MIKDQEMLTQAIEQHQTGNFQETEILYRQILQNNPENDVALYYLGIMACELGQSEIAIENLRKAIDINPIYEYYKDLGNIYFDINNNYEAIHSYEQVIKLNNNDIDVYFNLGLLYWQVREIEKARNSFENVIRINNNDAEAYNHLGSIYYNEFKDAQKAIECFNRVIEINPGYADGYFNLALAYNSINEKDNSIKSYQKAVEINPEHFQAYLNLGILLIEKDRIEESIVCFERVIQLKPDYPEAYYNLGNSLQEKGEFEKAQFYYQKAAEVKPDFVEAYNGLGLALSQQGRLDEAIKSYKKAIELNSSNAVKEFAVKLDFAEIYINLGRAFYDNLNIDQAIKYYQKAIDISPGYSEAYFGLAYINLLNGNFDKGWEYYEHRLSIGDKKNKNLPVFIKPKWNGKESIQGKTIFVYHEQGFGDSLQFVRYLPLLHSLGAKVLFKPQKGLEKLLKQSDLKAEIIDNSIPDKTLTYDTHISLMSLPYCLKANSENVPFKDKYLKVDPEKVDYYRKKYFQTDKFKVGIFWQGRKEYKDDNNRSIPLEYFLKLSQIKDVKLFSFQKGYGIEQLEDISERIEIINLGETFNDFLDTAAAIENLDLFITIDTSVAHLSAALNKPTWILLSYVPEWRWGLTGETSYWYNSVELFRQRDPGNWDELLNRVTKKLNNILRNCLKS
ncbi:MAG: hypothetical protein A2255_06245 [Candidatus Melainabacteria bacterium RIFOXYA2_FULL_32_9]|nr:MAG: hypothetical protein A2255_06245 [Candidatus Melainabacteria bacterium RIFOXYA2_FULL_32_9]